MSTTLSKVNSKKTLHNEGACDLEAVPNVQTIEMLSKRKSLAVGLKQ